MARLASQSQGGYYATPPKEVELICNRLAVAPEATVNLLDPCCGEGLALKQISDYLANQGATPLTFGVELEETRAEKAKSLLHKVVKGGYENLRATNEVFSFMWLNPPYDNAGNGQRMETNFLRNLTQPGKYLQPGGLLGFCIPQYVLKECAWIIGNRFQDVHVYRFTDENYPMFKQIVVFGYQAKGRVNPKEAKATRERLEAISDLPFTEVPTLAELDGITFTVPEADREVTLFRGSILDPVEIAADIDASPAWNDFENLVMPENLREKVTLKRPVLPLKPSHMGVAIASGAVGGNMTDHILVGLTAKEVVNDVQYEQDEKTSKTRLTQLERYVTKIRVFSQHEGAKGVFTLE